MIKIPGQSLLDICVQETGTIETLFDVLHLNQLDMTNAITEPVQLIMPPVVKKQIVDYISTNKIQMSTDYTNE